MYVGYTPVVQCAGVSVSAGITSDSPGLYVYTGDIYRIPDSNYLTGMFASYASVLYCSVHLSSGLTGGGEGVIAGILLRSAGGSGYVMQLLFSTPREVSDVAFTLGRVSLENKLRYCVFDAVFGCHVFCVCFQEQSYPPDPGYPPEPSYPPEPGYRADQGGGELRYGLITGYGQPRSESSWSLSQQQHQQEQQQQLQQQQQHQQQQQQPQQVPQIRSVLYPRVPRWYSDYVGANLAPSDC